MVSTRSKGPVTPPTPGPPIPRKTDSSLRTIILILLPLLAGLGVFGTWVLSFSNGTFKGIGDLLAQNRPLLPGSDDLIVRKLTGIGPLDSQLQVLVTFFAPVVNSSTTNLTLFSILGLGQFGAAWTILMMESMRFGNKGKLVSFIGSTGVLIQNVAFTVIVPLYLALHLVTSPVAKSISGKGGSSMLLISSVDLKILPLSVTFGYLIPSILMCIPSPAIFSPETHQRYIAFWQAFPIWTSVIHWSVRYLVSMISTPGNDQSPSTPVGAAYLKGAKQVYRFVLVLAMVTQIPVTIIAVLPAKYLPELSLNLAPLSNAKLLNVFALSNTKFTDVFVPYLPLLSHKVPDLATGVLTFLQWDLYIGSTALILWAVLLYQNAKSDKRVAQPDTSLLRHHDLLFGGIVRNNLSVKILVWTLVSGPMGALAVLLWERDIIVGQKIKH